ncbi:MAG TPA: response regulator transcription factor [Thermomicrobiales bacterium]|nr:response regulator transcription factor [Thermomicrobiales bacterium]
MPSTTILTVEDESALVRLIRDYLVHEGFRAIAAQDARTALQRVQDDKPDLVILDLGLPDRNGFDVLREIRRTSDTPIIILTARGEETDRVVGLELGADDYMVKPFSPKELVARIRAIMRRVDQRPTTSETLTAGDLVIDIPRMRITRGGQDIDLTATEFQIVAAMVREPGRVFTRGYLLDAIHGVIIESYERAIDAHIKNIRRKLEPDPAHPRYIVTVHGVGYRFTDDR